MIKSKILKKLYFISTITLILNCNRSNIQNYSKEKENINNREESYKIKLKELKYKLSETIDQLILYQTIDIMLEDYPFANEKKYSQIYYKLENFYYKIYRCNFDEKIAPNTFNDFLKNLPTKQAIIKALETSISQTCYSYRLISDYIEVKIYLEKLLNNENTTIKSQLNFEKIIFIHLDPENKLDQANFRQILKYTKLITIIG